MAMSCGGKTLPATLNQVEPGIEILGSDTETRLSISGWTRVTLNRTANPVVPAVKEIRSATWNL